MADTASIVVLKTPLLSLVRHRLRAEGTSLLYCLFLKEIIIMLAKNWRT